MNKLVLASNNAGKLAELAQLLSPLNIHLQPQSAYAVPDCPEPHATFVENALAKARHASRISGLPALADDSGICAVALGGAPGVHSARFGGEEPKSDAANNAKLNAKLANQADLSVYYVCVLVLLRHADDPQPLIAEGQWNGRILHARQGSGGHGYDPVFFDPVHGQSAAQMAAAFKNGISHRGQALAVLAQRLATL